ncbi:hypothetical protein BD410DRAFT_811641 [Rickenella mellea]|uniref:Uncharacterized protein n=1 Tax=Rickenella mellea TaxID=50990 RepID=A0A4Y7QLN2_9AGAM|nr:hypothetical protein BD410DRAFT_811641 [Rickenella mellea]
MLFFADRKSRQKSYLSFCKLHHLPLDPTPDTLSFFVVYMAHHINPSSVASYLSGICSTLEPHFPGIRQARQSILKQFSTAVHRKSPLPLEALHHSNQTLSTSPSHDSLLFLAMLCTGFFALLRLGELASPDNPQLRSFRKIIMRHTVHLDSDFFGFTLPYHKADRFFEGNEVRIQRQPGSFDPRRIFLAYLSRRDDLFSYRAELWIRANGDLPTRTWFLTKLHSIVPDLNIAGHSLRSGGATYYAVQGVPDNRSSSF